MDCEQNHYPNRLKAIRQNAGYNMKQVAKFLGHRTTAMLSEWENEKIMPTGTNLIKLCILYDSTPRELYPEFYERVETHTVRPVAEISRRRYPRSQN